MRLGYLLAILLVAAPSSWQFTTEETCDYCQAVLRGFHGYFTSSSNAPSKRLVAKQLHHRCNRHYEVKESQHLKQCLVSTKVSSAGEAEVFHFSRCYETYTFQTKRHVSDSKCPVETAIPLVPNEPGPWEKELEAFFTHLSEN